MRNHVRPVLLLAVTAGLCVGVVGAQSPDVSSPRATFDSFLSAMVAVRQGESARLADAIACLDVSSVPPLIRDEAAEKFARGLKTYLDKVERIDIDSLPERVDGSTWIYRKTSEGEVSLRETSDGRWLFSEATRASLPALLESVRDRKFVEGLAGGGVEPTFAEWLRGKMPESMTRRVLLIETWQWLALLALALLGVIVDRVVRLMLGLWLRRLLAGSQHLRGRDVDADFERPIGILTMGLVWLLLLPLVGLPLRPLAALKFASQVVIAGGGVWGAYRLVDLVAAHFMALARGSDTKIDDILVPMLRRALKIVVIAFGVLFVAQNLDVDITSLLAGLGIGGVALALAAKDTVENLFGSMTVLIDRPFQIGDWVVIDDLEGTVEEIGFRSTRIRTFYNSRITVPNARLVHTSVDNLGERRYRRLKCMVSIEYGTPPERIDAFCEGIRELIRQHPYTRKDYYNVYFNEFAGSSLNILLYAFHETPDWTTELRERHRLLVDIIRLARRLQVEFAFPTQTLHVASVPSALTAAPRPDAADREAAAQPDARRSAAAVEQAVVLGRAEAEAIVRETGSTAAQPPVDFADPERIRPGR